MKSEESAALLLLERLLRAVNDHDVEALVACFGEGYVNETPAHPQRSFSGADQVRRNWTQIFAGVADIRAQVPRHTIDGDTLWTEWEMTGTRADGHVFHLRGVVIFGVAGTRMRWARFYLEPVEHGSGDVTAAINRAVGGVAASPSGASGKERS